jgi:hypothetical protein
MDIADSRFGFARKREAIAPTGQARGLRAHEAALDGIYVVRTSLPATVLDDAATVRNYKSLSLVERAFRCLKSVDLQIRPVYHWLAIACAPKSFCAMLAYYLEWHMRQCLAPMLYDDTTRTPPKHSASASSPRPNAPPPPLRSRPLAKPRTGCRFTASARYWPTLPP